MAYSVKSLFEIYEVVIQAVLMVEIFLSKDLKVEHLLNGAAPWSETGLFLSKYSSSSFFPNLFNTILSIT